MYSGGEFTFSGLIIGAFTTLFYPAISDSRLGHCFGCNAIFSPNVSVHVWACTVLLSAIGFTCLLSSEWLLFHWAHVLVFGMINFFIGLTCLLSSVWLLFHCARVLVFGMSTFSLGSLACCLRYDYFFTVLTCLLSSVWLLFHCAQCLLSSVWFLFHWAHMRTVFGMITCSCFHSL